MSALLLALVLGFSLAAAGDPEPPGVFGDPEPPGAAGDPEPPGARAQATASGLIFTGDKYVIVT
jgi:hypothetical protein